MGKNAKRRRELRQANRRQQQPTTTSNRTVTPAEQEAIYLIAAGQHHSNPPCGGPIVIHLDGVIECHGDCEGVMKAFHDDDSLAPCSSGLGELRHRCRRCDDGVALLGP